MSAHLGKRAIVIGAGMAGLIAARSLADFFERVVVLENDSLPSHAAQRPGTPQCRHVHALQPSGLQSLGRLFPGFEESLSQAGAVWLRAGYDYRVERQGYDPFPQRDLGISIYSMTRPLLEFTVRKRLGDYRNIELREGCRAQELIAVPADVKVASVRCKSSGGNEEILAADLVVDASGNGNLTLGLLTQIGGPLPEETAIGIDMGYATTMFDIPADAPDWKGVYTFPDYPKYKIGALMLPVEGNRWILTIGGRYDDKPQSDWEGFLQCAQRLRTPTIYNTIRRANRSTEIARYGMRASRWRHFERLERFPRALIPIGDTICRFNPVYGQGMSVAAMEVEALSRLLAERRTKSDGLAELAQAFFAETEKIIDAPWWGAAIPDFIDPRTEGQRPPDLENSLKFSAALLELAARDATVHKLLIEVQSLLRPRAELRNPELVQRVKEVMEETEIAANRGSK